MFVGYQEKEEYEDELYREEEGSSLSEADSELEFRLYSQLHYSLHSEGLDEQADTAGRGLDEQADVEPRPGVIVIDSGPEVFTISDSSDVDSGICAAKGKRSRRPDSANRGRFLERPAPQPAPWGSPLSVSSDSDSDGLENWMILGQKNLDGDCSIQLNLEGGANSSAAEDEDAGHNWSILEKDKEAHISNRNRGALRTPNRYYIGKNVTCRSCNKTGHLSKNCPTPKKLPSCMLCGEQGHLQRACPSRYCNNCGHPGHLFADCLERAYWHKQCHRCAMTGHFYDACPEIWRQYHLTTKRGPLVTPESENPPRNPAYCCNCSRRGHFGFECEEKRMFNGTYPAAPYISYYDTPQDIRQRDNRMQRKAKELQEAGFLLPTPPEETLGPQGGAREEEQPRKKRKKKSNGWERRESQGVTGVPKAKPQDKQPRAKAKARTWPEKRRERWETKKIRRESPAQRGGQMDPEDFPRGPKRKSPGAPPPPKRGKASVHLFSSGRQKAKKARGRGRDRKPGTLRIEDVYPADENLFLIKQKKKHRRKR